MATDPRVDTYLAGLPAFAVPILTHLRALVHQVVPSVDETMKWGRPFFTLDGRMLAMMSAFKAHCIFGFWRSEAGGPDRGESAGGDYGRITSLADLPADEVIIGQIRTAVAQLDMPPAKRVRAAPKPALETPADLAAALAAEPEAQATFDAFSPSCRREYVEWVVEAKRPETRANRIAKAVGQMREGKKLNYRYQ
ncbi:YdeI family protein [Sphingomonas sp. MMS24-J13]|uniref:YdeI/OmpD-associated family protein n=1 Tax=Sphingomonas sp. MMS24-J13 TaxID=3238686 RepID=UPI00384C5F25